MHVESHAGRLAKAMVFILAWMAYPGPLQAQEQPSAAQIREALKPKPPTHARGRAVSVRTENSEDQRFLQRLRTRSTFAVSVEERAKVADIARQKPGIDLEVNFDYDSAAITSKAVPAVVELGTALRSPDFKGAVFILGGHTDAKGGDAYNQQLSERRAEAVKQYLVEKFSIPPENLIAIGFGKEQIKNKADPFAGENRRVQIVNTELK